MAGKKPRHTKAQAREVTPKGPRKATGKKGAPKALGASDPGTSSDTTTPTSVAHAQFPIVGIGASAGGLEAFTAFFEAMPEDSGLAFVLIAHLDPNHVSLLPELLQKSTDMPVRQARDGDEIRPDMVYVIPPNRELSIVNRTLQLMNLEKPRGARLPIDVFFRALAQDQGPSAICIILSGTGTDGTHGLKAVKGEAGMAMVQSPESAKFDGMPRSAVATGLADFVLPPEAMPQQLLTYVKHAALGNAPRVIPGTGAGPEALSRIFMILRGRTNHDFSLYKKNTICRRVERRMSIHQLDSVAEYVRLLQESEREAEVLFKELLIGVTNFFRDPDAFDALARNALRQIIDSKSHEGSVRVWVPGCSSGEEAYSIAILLRETMDNVKRHVNVQIFGTDIDEDAIAAARAGIYPSSIVSDVSPTRLERFFTKEEDGRYKISKTIREMVVFAVQNMIKDPPFTKLDLLSCRNLLIYLGPELQRKLLPMFSYALNRGGVLFLGSSETVGKSTDLFDPEDKKWKIFKCKASGSQKKAVLDFPPEPDADDESTGPLEAVKTSEVLNTLRLVETILKLSGAPPCVIVDEVFDVVYVHGRTGSFLEPAEGEASANIVDMARPGLKLELAAALRNVVRNKKQVVRRGLKVQQNGFALLADLKVTPILEIQPRRGLMMVTLDKAAESTSTLVGSDAAPVLHAPPAGGSPRKSVEELEQELLEMRESLQTTIEDLETSNEELKSANEELQSTNEELQSTNEELETSKEELQSLNEESATVNAELQSHLDELTKTNDDMKNLLDSTDVATIFLDTELRVRRFTPRATVIIPLEGVDIDRPVAHFASRLVDVDLAADAEQVLRDLAPRELKVSSTDGRCYRTRIRPYRTVQNVIDGVVITFDDITELEAAAARSQDLFRGMVDTVREPLVVLDDELRVVAASASFYSVFEVKQPQTEGLRLHELGSRQWDIKALNRLLERVLTDGESFDDFTVDQHFPGIGRQTMILNARRLVVEGDRQIILLAIENQRAD